jgi:E3 ubiquitin-protein ligase SHPRH
LIQNKIRRAQFFEQQERFQDALDIYLHVLKPTSDMVERLQEEQRVLEAQRAQDGASNSEDEDENIIDVHGSKRRRGRDGLAITIEVRAQNPHDNPKLRLLHWKQIQHKILFFIGSIYNSFKKQKVERLERDPDNILQEEARNRDQEEEDGYYAKANVVREDILRPKKREVESWTQSLGQVRVKQDLIPVPARNNPIPVLARVTPLIKKLNEQWQGMMEWRQKVLFALTLPLDHAEDQGPTGKEFEQNLDIQAEANYYQEAYLEALLDRREALLGIVIARSQVSVVRDRLEAATDLARSLAAQRSAWHDSLRAMSHLMDELRQFRDRKHDLTLEVSKLQQHIHEQITRLDQLDHEKNIFSRVHNARIPYFYQLQELSDDVEHIKFRDNFGRVLEQCDREDERLDRLFRQEDAKRVYFANQLSSGAVDAAADEAALPCSICLDTVYVECAVTPCGHVFCKEDAMKYFGKHGQKCPICRVMCLTREMEFSASAAVLQARREKMLRRETGAVTGLHEAKCITDSDPAFPWDVIRNCRIKGSWGTKIDFLVKHISILRDKVIVFSQFDGVLKIVEQALTENKIGFARPDVNAKGRGLEDFLKDDDRIKVFLLHSRSQSSGLTLTIAKHVFVIEPLVNLGSDRQAISRVHRIGQTKETFVYRLVMEDTVEEQIFDLHERKRRQLMDELNGHEVSDVEDDGRFSSQLKLKSSRTKSSKGETVSQLDLLGLFSI